MLKLGFEPSIICFIYNLKHESSIIKILYTNPGGRVVKLPLKNLPFRKKRVGEIKKKLRKS